MLLTPNFNPLNSLNFSHSTTNFLNSVPQQEIAESISVIQYLINQIPESVLWIDSQGGIKHYNDAACALLGYSREQLSNLTIEEAAQDFLNSDWSRYWKLIQRRGFGRLITHHPYYEDHQSLDITVNFLKYGDQDYISIVARSLNFLESEKDGYACRIHPSVNSKQAPQSLIQRSSTPQPNFFDSLACFYPDSSQLKPVFEFIEANYSQPITLNDVAGSAGYSPAYLTNLVKRRTGKTIIHWIVERRMLEARSLLLKTHKSITQIAATVGFTDPYYFSRRFSQLYKVSPKRWREKHQTQVA